MADDGAERQRIEFIEKHYPLIQQGADPGGRWIEVRPHPRSRPPHVPYRQWEPQTTWRTKHGEAFVLWSHGHATGALEALLPDGTRGEIRVGSGANRFRRKGTGERLWIHGTLQIRPDDVIFVDGEQPSYAPPPLTGDSDLEAELARDKPLLDAIKDDTFARALYSILSTHEVIHLKTGQQFGFGNSQSARIVINLRASGEIVSDYVPNGHLPGIWPDDRAEHAEVLSKIRSVIASLWHEPRRSHQENDKVYDLLHAHLTRLGWRTLNAGDQKLLSAEHARRAVRVLQEVKQLERRMPAPLPEWAQEINKMGAPKGAGQYVLIAQVEGMTEDEKFVAHPGALPKRIDELAISGRITKDEYDTLLARLPMSQDAIRALLSGAALP